MDYLNEAVALGVDAIILGFCLKEYFGAKRNLHNLKAAPTLNIDSELKNYVIEQKNNKVPYVLISGTVTPLEAPLLSLKVQDVKSVIHVQKLREHQITRRFCGWWRERNRLIHTSVASIPFELSQNDCGVEVLDALSAKVLDLQLLSHNYEPTSVSFWDQLFSYMSGERQKGVHTSEEILRCGTYMTAVGELSIKNGKLSIGPSSMGPMFLTTSPKEYLIQRLTSLRNSAIFRVILTSSVAAVLTGLIIRKLLMRRKEKKLKEMVEAERHKRNVNSHHKTKIENSCIVCAENPKEIVFLPCGHICMCFACSNRTKKNCPICRERISSRHVAFIS